MNKWVGIGRLVADPEVRCQQGDNSSAVARYRLAVDRKYRKQGEEQTADFINCVAFGKSAEFVEKYLIKGMKIAVVGRIQTGSYTNNDGNKVYTTDIVVEEHEFVESKGSGSASSKPEPETGADGFYNLPDNIPDDLPFN